jgi:arylamine N-acetyltransferase
LRLKYLATEILNDNYSSGLEDWLDKQTADQFLAVINLSRKKPSLEYLTNLIRAGYTTIPFQNLTMLNRPREAPSPEEIIRDMLNGIGGLCTTSNPFFCAFLHQLGFSVGLISASMEKPNCHIALLVAINGNLYWTDLGNGFPYLTPLLIEHGARASHVGFNYELIIDGSTVFVNQTVPMTKKMKKNHSFEIKPVHYSYFEEMRQKHYQVKDYGPFLSGIRINRWELNKGYLLRDNLIWKLPGKAQKADPLEIENWIKRYFNGDFLVPAYRKSTEVLLETNNK